MDIVIVVGDEGIRLVLEQLLDLLSSTGVQVVAVTSDRRTVRHLTPVVSRDPLHVQVVELDKYEGITEHGLNDDRLLTADQRQFLFDDPVLYAAGSDTGAVTRPEAAARTFLSRGLKRALERALKRATSRPHAHGILKVRVLVIATTYRNTGSGALAVLLGSFNVVSEEFRRLARIELDVITGAQSVYHAGVEGLYAGIGRRAAHTELTVAEELGVPVGPGLTVPKSLVTHVIEVGAPGLHQGVIDDEEQARRALALTVRAYLAGATGEAIASQRPFSSSVVVQVHAESGVRTRFSGMGAVEVVFEPEAARDYLAAHMLAALPPM